MRFLAQLILCLLCSHVLYSLALAKLTSAWYTHRLLNVRHVDQDYKSRRALVSGFLRANSPSGHRVVGVFGSSFTWGYSFASGVTFPKRVEDRLPGTRVLNVSVIGDSLQDIGDNLELAITTQTKMSVVLLEVPVVNALDRLRRGDGGPRRQRVLGGHGSSYFEWFLTTPWGPHHLSVIWDEYAYDIAERELALAKLPEDYFVDRASFERVRERYGEEIRQTLGVAVRLARRVYAFPSAVYLPGVAHLGFDRDCVSDQLRFTEEVAGSVRGVTALRLDDDILTNPENFGNVTHLNVRGHRAFGDWLAERIAEGLHEDTARH